jgi:hypothetical protein
MRRINTRLIYGFQSGRPLTGFSLRLGRLGTLTFLR